MSSTPPFLTQSPQIAYWPGRGSGWLTVWQKPEKNGPKPFPCITLVSMSALCTWIFIHEAQKLCCVLIEKAKSCSALFIKLFFSSINPPVTLAGTYNNQYMVLDRSKVKLGHSLDDGALTVVEQIPSLVEYSDQTQTLRRGS